MNPNYFPRRNIITTQNLSRSPAPPDSNEESTSPPTVQETTSPTDGTGRLIFRVTTASGAIPLSGARVTLWDHKTEPNTDRGNARASMITDRNGKTSPIDLPAPTKSLSLSPTPNGSPPPFACYDAEVFLDGYFAMTYICIPVFDGITSVQPADLIPLPQNGFADGFTSEDSMNFESQAPDL